MSKIRGAHVAFGAVTFLGAVGAGYVFARGGSDKKAGKEEGNAKFPNEKERKQTFDSVSGIYDKEIGMDELVMGVPLMRRWLVGKAHGEVLEVAAGTGRNLNYYKNGTHVTAIDFSEGMLAQARAKDEKSPNPRVRRWLQADAARLPFADGSFDTVLDTFGLCSFEDPVACLREMRRVCRPGGQVLLLEHGRSSYAFVSRILDDGALQHALKWGCFWNRDISALIAEAGGLKIKSHTTWHFGTTHIIVARRTLEHSGNNLLKPEKSVLPLIGGGRRPCVATVTKDD